MRRSLPARSPDMPYIELLQGYFLGGKQGSVGIMRVYRGYIRDSLWRFFFVCVLYAIIKLANFMAGWCPIEIWAV